MRKFVLILISLGFLFSCSNEQNKHEITTDIITNPETANGENSSDKIAAIKFDQTDFNFGSVIAGEKVTHTYKFKNVGLKDLVLATVKPS
jgi:hypothetical protein